MSHAYRKQHFGTSPSAKADLFANLHLSHIPSFYFLFSTSSHQLHSTTFFNTKFNTNDLFTFFHFFFRCSAYFNKTRGFSTIRVCTQPKSCFFLVHWHSAGSDSGEQHFLAHQGSATRFFDSTFAAQKGCLLSSSTPCIASGTRSCEFQPRNEINQSATRLLIKKHTSEGHHLRKHRLISPCEVRKPDPVPIRLSSFKQTKVRRFQRLMLFTGTAIMIPVLVFAIALTHTVNSASARVHLFEKLGKSLENAPELYSLWEPPTVSRAFKEIGPNRRVRGWALCWRVFRKFKKKQRESVQSVVWGTKKQTSRDFLMLLADEFFRWWWFGMQFIQKVSSLGWSYCIWSLTKERSWVIRGDRELLSQAFFGFSLLVCSTVMGLCLVVFGLSWVFWLGIWWRVGRFLSFFIIIIIRTGLDIIRADKDMDLGIGRDTSSDFSDFFGIQHHGSGTWAG